MENNKSLADLCNEFPMLTRCLMERGFADGVEAERLRFAAFQSKFGDDLPFMIEQFAAGMTLDQADGILNVVLKRRIQQVKERLAAAQIKENVDTVSAK